VTCYKWPPPRRRKPLFLSVASSILSTEPDLETKTIKLGMIARAAALYRADRVIVYRDAQSSIEDYRVARLLLEYASTPPYLRKRLFPLSRKLRFAGLLYPVQTPSHAISPRLKPGDYIEVIVESCQNGVCEAFGGGVKGKIILRGQAKPGRRITVKVLEIKDDKVFVKREDPGFYWRFKVEAFPSLKQAIERFRSINSLIIGTSRLGDCDVGKVSSLISGRKSVLVVFGGPKGHVWEEPGVDKSSFDIILNLVPFQGNKTVRSEEAILAGMSKLDPFI
jgi:predicted SPOUT superfamily RNA methylase MTH1